MCLQFSIILLCPRENITLKLWFCCYCLSKSHSPCVSHRMSFSLLFCYLKMHVCHSAWLKITSSSGAESKFQQSTSILEHKEANRICWNNEDVVCSLPKGILRVDFTLWYFHLMCWLNKLTKRCKSPVYLILVCKVMCKKMFNVLF